MDTATRRELLRYAWIFVGSLGVGLVARWWNVHPLGSFICSFLLAWKVTDWIPIHKRDRSPQQTGNLPQLDIKQGSRITLMCVDNTVTGSVMLCSPNKAALAVTLDEGLRLPHGVVMSGALAILWLDGTYRELLSGVAIQINIVY